MTVPPLPSSLKAVQHYLKTAQEHDARDPVVAYYCRLYSLQKAMGIDKKSPEARAWLMAMMDQLEKTKQRLKDNEAIQNEVVGQATMEEYACKVFLYADNEDRAGRFGKNVVKSFYSAAMLFDVCTNFGDLPEELENNRKYARWKAAYIHNCLKNGQTPVAGPLGGENEEEGATGGIGFEGMSQPHQPSVPQIQHPGHSTPSPSSSGGHISPPSQGHPSAAGGYPTNSGGYRSPNYGTHAPPTTPNDPPAGVVPHQPAMSQQHPGAVGTQQRYQPPASGAVDLRPEDYQRAMKLCKFANSALQYEDSQTAIDNLTKALNLLTTGKE